MPAQVSIIMASYNSAPYIEEAIASVVSQSFTNWELLVSDDCSSDGTVEMVSGIARDEPRIRLLTSDRNRGPAAVRNDAIEQATGQFIAFLDSDDLWKPEKLERQIAFMREREVAFSFTSYDRIDEGGRFISSHHVSRPVSYGDLLKSCVIGCLTAVYDRDRLGKMFMPDIRKRQDFALWLQILKKVDHAVPLEESLASYRVRSGSVSANKFVAASYTWSVYRDVEKLDMFRSIYYFVHYAYNGVRNNYLSFLVRKH